MAFYKVVNKITVAQLVPSFKNKIPHAILKKEVADLAYDARSFKRFPGIKKGIKVYISPYPFAVKTLRSPGAFKNQECISSRMLPALIGSNPTDLYLF